MTKKSTILDTNLLIRFFAEDNKSQADAVENLLQNVKKDELELPDVAIAEIVWVLLSYYKLSKEDVIEKLEGILALNKIKINRAVIEKTVIFFRKYNISYTDAYLCAYAQQKGSGEIYSFDQALDKLRDITRLQP